MMPKQAIYYISKLALDFLEASTLPIMNHRAP
jgi:hypothetical protein